MNIPLNKDLKYSYTIEDLTLLLPIFLLMETNSYNRDEYYATETELAKDFINKFISWLAEEDKTKLI